LASYDLLIYEGDDVFYSDKPGRKIKDGGRSRGEEYNIKTENECRLWTVGTLICFRTWIFENGND
jgi:hypothetical protein